MRKPLSGQQLFFRVLLLLGSIVALKMYFHSSTEANQIGLSDLESQFQDHKKSFADLPQGRTHYELSGSQEDPLVVLIHGVSGPMTAWDKNISYLNENRLRTLRYDLYGRGYSDRIEADYDLAVYLQQIEDLLKFLEIKQPVAIVASSFGSVIATAFANRFPEQVSKLTLIGPAGFPIETPALAKLRDVPVFGNVTFALMGKSIIIEQNQKYFVDQRAWLEHEPFFKAQLNVRGSDLAILSTMRHSPVQSFEEGFRTFGKGSVPMMVLWGKEDKTFPYKWHKSLQEWIPQMHLITVENSAHLPQFERPQVVNPYLLTFLEPDAS